MSRVVPSEVVEFIKEVFPWVDDVEKEARLGVEYAPQLAGLLRLIDQIPPELLQIRGSDYADLVTGAAGIDSMIKIWQSHGPGADTSQRFRKLHHVARIKQALAKCADESPSPTTADLAFIPDVELRGDIRGDISAATGALQNGEWKGATILAGSATEALLLWALQNKKAPAEIAVAVSALTPKGFRSPRDLNPETWGLHEYIEVAAQLLLISGETASQARLAKEFRNLIHPGRSARLAQKCDRATALSALAAVEHVVRDLA